MGMLSGFMKYKVLKKGYDAIRKNMKKKKKR